MSRTESSRSHSESECLDDVTLNVLAEALVQRSIESSLDQPGSTLTMEDFEDGEVFYQRIDRDHLDESPHNLLSGDDPDAANQPTTSFLHRFTRRNQQRNRFDVRAFNQGTQA